MSKSIKTFLFAILLLPCAFLLAACSDILGYNINFVVDEQVYQTVKTQGNEYITMPRNPEKLGYEFKGWYFDKDTWQNEFKAGTYADQALTQNVNVYAHFVLSVTMQINVDVYVDGVKTDTLYTSDADNFMITAPVKPADCNTDPTIKKYFYGWFTDSECTTPLTANTRFTTNSSIYAKWLDVNEADYEYTNTNGIATITKYNNATGSSIAVVPKYINSIPVKEIGVEAFKNTKVGTLIICDGVEVIGDRAFENCGYLSTVIMSDSVRVIGDDVFWTSYRQLKHIRVSSGLTSLATRAFPIHSTTESVLNYNKYDNAYYIGNETNKYIALITARSKDIESVEIANGCRFICCEAFIDCVNLKGVNFPDSVIGIDKEAFAHCKSINTLKLPENLTSISENCFDNCSGLTQLTIPSGVTQIGENAFWGCCALAEIYNLSDLTLAKGTGDDGSVALYAKVIHTDANAQTKLVTKGKGIYYASDNEMILLATTDRNITSFTVANGCTTIGSFALNGYDYLEQITIPNTVETINECAISNLPALESVKFADNSQLTRIAYGTFNSLPKLMEIVIPASVTTMQNAIFDNCNKDLRIYCEATSQPEGWDATWVENDTRIYWYSETEPTTTWFNYWRYVKQDGIRYIALWN